MKSRWKDSVGKNAKIRITMLILFVLTALFAAGCTTQDNNDNHGEDGKKNEAAEKPEVTAEVKATEAPEAIPEADKNNLPTEKPEATPDVTPEVTPEITEAPVDIPVISAGEAKEKLVEYYDNELVRKYGEADDELFLTYVHDLEGDFDWPDYSGLSGKTGLMGRMFLDYDGDGFEELLTARTDCTDGYISVNVLVYRYDVVSDSIEELTRDMLVSPHIGEANYSMQGSCRLLEDGLYVYFTDGFTFDLHEGGFCYVGAAGYRLGLDGSCVSLFSEGGYVNDWTNLEEKLVMTAKYMPSVYDGFMKIKMIEGRALLDEKTPGFTPLSRTDGDYIDIFTWQLMKEKDCEGYSTSVEPLYSYSMWYGENGTDPLDTVSVNYPTNGYSVTGTGDKKGGNKADDDDEDDYWDSGDIDYSFIGDDDDWDSGDIDYSYIGDDDDWDSGDIDYSYFGDDDGEYDHTYGYGLKTDLPYDPPYTEYIIFDSEYKELTKSDVSFLTKEELRLARNEIYARYGRKFSSEDLQKHFNSCSWYTPRYEPDQFNDDWLSSVEKKNVKLLKELEDSKK